MFFEIRRYQTRPGSRAAWVRYMEEVVLPYQQAAGMTAVASFVDEQDDDGYVWIRRFEDEEQRIALYDAAYGAERWRNEIAPRVEELLLLDRSVITRLTPTPTSAMR